jgi:hypothetical protein
MPSFAGVQPSTRGRMPVSFHKKPKKPSAVIHLDDDPVEEIPLPVDQEFGLTPDFVFRFP